MFPKFLQIDFPNWLTGKNKSTPEQNPPSGATVLSAHDRRKKGELARKAIAKSARDREQSRKQRSDDLRVVATGILDALGRKTRTSVKVGGTGLRIDRPGVRGGDLSKIKIAKHIPQPGHTQKADKTEVLLTGVALPRIIGEREVE